MSKSILGLEEIKDCKKLFKQLFAEFLGTFLYLSIVLLAGTSLGSSVVGTAVANGLIFASIIPVIAHISGAHMNPAITFGVLFYGRLKIIKSLLYILVQILGAVLGSFVAYMLTVSSSRGDLGAIIPYSEFNFVQVIGLEFLITFLLVTVFLRAMIDEKHYLRGIVSAAIAIGLTITACQSAALMYTASLNPIRSLGPALVMNIWTHHWAYWVAQLLAGAVAGVTYRYILRPNFVIDSDIHE